MITDTTQFTAVPWTLVNVASKSGLLADIRNRIAMREGFSVATLNLDHAVKLRRDPGFQKAYAAHTHVTADGRPIVWLSALAGRPVDLITGSDLVDPLAALCAEQRAPVAFFGSTQTVLDTAAERLQARYPGLEIAIRLAPSMMFDPDGVDAEAMIQALLESGVRVCLLALGAPKQEIFAARAARNLPNVGFMSIGAGLDFVAGAQRRAPFLLRRLALEWIWRILGNPRRLAWRYARCFALLPGLTHHALRMRRGGKVETTK